LCAAKVIACTGPRTSATVGGRPPGSWKQVVARYGPMAVFVGRFVPGLRFLIGPVAGITGLRPLPFIVANVLGALLYVPAAVGVGYAIGLGLGDYLAQVKRPVAQLDHVVPIVVICLTITFLLWRALRAARQG